MLNTAVIIGLDRHLFENELKTLVEKTFSLTSFKNKQEAYEASLDYFFINHEDLHRSDSNSNSCLVIKKIENKNQLQFNEIDLTKNEFNKFIDFCKNFPQQDNWVSKNISKAFLNLADKIKFNDVKLFLMNYSWFKIY